MIFLSMRGVVIPCVFSFAILANRLAPSQQAGSAPPTQACSQTDVCKAAGDAHTDATSAESAATNALKAATAAQTSAGNASDLANAAKDAADAATAAATQAANAADAAAKSLKSAASQGPQRAKARIAPLGDYVPCLFDEGQVYDLRAQADPSQKPLTEAEAETAVGTIQSNLQSTAPAGGNSDPTLSASQLLKPSMLKNVPRSNVGAVATAAVLSQPGTDPTRTAAAAAAAQTAVGGATTATFERPPDVSCSFSILQWKETSDTFGRRVANQYIAIQVNVRNLNTQNEFLIHDIQIAVDTGMNREQFGHFKASRDKLIVRDVAQRGQTSDRRNLVINSLQMAGAIAGGASAAVTQSLASTTAANDVSTAVAIFQGPFITGLINIFPDHTIEHINHINDLTFSASSANKTVVPVQGSVPLVTFLSERPVEQLPFAHCGGKGNAGKALADEVVKDSICSIDNDPPSTPPASTKNISEYYGKPLSFKKWDALAVSVLERRVFVVIAGVHIKEAAKEPTFTSITCAPGNDATIALAKITELMANCTLKGTDLDLVSRVELQNPNDSTDKADGASSVSGDNTQATVQFSTSDLAKLKGTSYTLYYSLKGGSPVATKLTVTVQQVVSLSPASLTFSQADKDHAKSITLTTNAPDKAINIASVTITGQNADDFKKTAPSVTCGGAVKTPPTAVSTGCTISVTFSGNAAATALLTIVYDVLGNPQLTQTVNLTATAQ